MLDALSLLSDDFTVTWVSQVRQFPTPETLALIVKPEPRIRQMFGFDREILLLYSSRKEFQARMVQVADRLLEQNEISGRVETLLYFFLSPARNVFDVARVFAADSRQNRIAIPFQVGEAAAGQQSTLVVRRLQEHLFSRDLFDIEQPITNDTFFFGRNQFVVETRDAIKQGNNVGLFGLRKTGKTSLVFKFQRLLAREKIATVEYLDLQDPGLYGLRWWELLRELAVRIDPAIDLRAFDESHAARSFRETVERMAARGGRRIVIALDEIEHIVPGLSLREHWNRDFLEFWKTVRAVQNTNRHVTFIVAGVNASAVETATFDGFDNPLFSWISVRYVPPFGVTEVADMIGKLGHYMGLTFDEDVFEFLHGRYGGHPLLTRLVASRLYQSVVTSKRLPFHVDQVYVVQRAAQVDRTLFPMAEHVLAVLKDLYRSEYEMLECLAGNDCDFFEEMTASVPQYAEHLKAYGLVTLNPGRIAMPFLASYLRTQLTNVTPPGPEELGKAAQLAEIGRLRNELEPRLRAFIRQMLKAKMGAHAWIDPVLKAIPSERAAKLQGVDADIILAEHLYLQDLITVIDKNWAVFNVLERGPKDEQMSREQFKILLHFVNAHREDAHAKEIGAAEFATVKVAVMVLDKALSLYVD